MSESKIARRGLHLPISIIIVSSPNPRQKPELPRVAQIAFYHLAIF